MEETYTEENKRRDDFNELKKSYRAEINWELKAPLLSMPRRMLRWTW